MEPAAVCTLERVEVEGSQIVAVGERLIIPRALILELDSRLDLFEHVTVDRAAEAVAVGVLDFGDLVPSGGHVCCDVNVAVEGRGDRKGQKHGSEPVGLKS